MCFVKECFFSILGRSLQCHHFATITSQANFKVPNTRRGFVVSQYHEKLHYFVLLTLRKIKKKVMLASIVC